MLLYLYLFIFVISCFLISVAGGLLISALSEVTKFLGWKEFVVAFFSISFASSVPELFIGLSSAFHKTPQLSFGNIIGANVVHFTLAIALVVLVLKGMKIESRTVQTSSLFASIAAILPVILILDGVLSRADGVILILTFVFYVLWLFSKKERFVKIYEETKISISFFEKFKLLFKNLGLLFVGTILLLLSTEGIVRSASFFIKEFHLPLSLVGILIVGTGTALPETYFSVKAVKKKEYWLGFGTLIGSTVITATLVLGLVALICPILIKDFSPFFVGAAFVFISAIFFFFFVRTDRKITKKEAFFLILLYLCFLAVQVIAFL